MRNAMALWWKHSAEVVELLLLRWRPRGPLLTVHGTGRSESKSFLKILSDRHGTQNV